MVIANIGGKKRKFSFGLEVLGWLQVESGIDLTDPKEGVSESSLFYILIKPLILLGHKRELEKEGKRIDFDYDDVDKWIQQVGVTSEEVMKVWEEFNKSVVSYLPKQDGGNDKPKKK